VILAESYLDLVSDPAHIAFEMTYEFLTALIFYPVIRFTVKRLHRQWDKEHGVKHVVINEQPR
jgi:hypothetical protein